MTRIRMVIVTMTQFITDIITTLISPHADVVGNFCSRAEVENSVSNIAPDVILVSLGGSETDVFARTLLALAPFAKVIVVTTNVSGAYLYQAGAHRVDLKDVSSEEFIAAILGTQPRWLI
jgi:DNA-binding NarL/FixJ family response regulator